MSLETQISQLIAEYGALKQRYEDRADEIDQAVAEALATVPQMTRTYYVDAVIGDDAAVGNRNAPLASIEQAVRRTPYGGELTLYLANHEHTIKSDVFLNSVRVTAQRFATDGGGPTIVQASISEGVYVDAAFRGSGFWRSKDISYRTATLGADNLETSVHPRGRNAMFALRNFARLDVLIEYARIELGNAHFVSMGLGPGVIDFAQRGCAIVRRALNDGSVPGKLILTRGVVGGFATQGGSIPSGETWAQLLDLSSCAMQNNVGV